ncbi:MAG: hypothetical protein AB4290_29880 [Spirulina sp.]
MINHIPYSLAASLIIGSIRTIATPSTGATMQQHAENCYDRYRYFPRSRSPRSIRAIALPQ